jgi:ABC-type Fe3+/spermidine/putrescine transport system ATPase subunit
MIRLEGLHVAAGDFSLRVDELSVEKGEFLVFLGPTGSGKTVLLETLAGLRRPVSGRIWFGDRDVTEEPPERRRVGFVYQDYALFPHLSVAKNIAFGLSTGATRGRARGVRAGGGEPSGGADPDRAAALASLLGIEQLIDRYPDTLSGGEQQRVALARALAIEPEVLLLDEPLSALDRKTRRELRIELRRLHRELGATVLHVTHDLDEALVLGDRIAVLIDGDLRQIGTPEDVIRQPADGETARLLGMTNVFRVVGTYRLDGVERVRLARGPDPGGGDVGWATAEGAGGLELGVGALADELPGGNLVAVVRAEEIVLLAPGEAILGRVTRGRVSSADPPAGDLPSGTLLEGTVIDVQMRSVHASVEVDVPPVFTVHVLRPEVQRMGLSEGSRVGLWIPDEAVHVCPETLGESER